MFVKNYFKMLSDLNLWFLLFGLSGNIILSKPFSTKGITYFLIIYDGFSKLKNLAICSLLFPVLQNSIISLSISDKDRLTSLYNITLNVQKNNVNC